MSGAALINNNADGANYQAQAVLAYVRYLLGDGIESSWNDETKRYQADPRVTRFDNCREQGYAIFMRDINHDKQINIAFYEHRSSDGIEAIVSFAKTFNAPLLSDFHGEGVEKGETKYLNYGSAYDLAKWVVEQLTEFWEANSARRTLAEIRAENIAARAAGGAFPIDGLVDGAEA
jgi:hypothetical protein